MTTIELKKYINENNKIPFILEQISCHHIKDHGEYVSAGNPDGDNPASINIYKNDYLGYVNYTRGVSADMKQDIINLVQSAKKIDFIPAIKWLHEVNEIPFSFTQKSKVIEENKQDKIINIFKKYKINRRVCDIRDIKYIDPKEFRDMFPGVHIDIFREGVTKKAINKFSLKYDFSHHRTVFPIRWWQTGDIIATNERTSIKEYQLLGIPKYKLSKNYIKTNNLYGYWENHDEICSKGYITILETEKGVVKRYSRGDGTCVALEGHSLSQEQFRIILSLPIKEIVFALDKDVDIYEVMGLADRFYNLRTVSIIKDKHNWLGEKDSPSDADNRIYQKLFKERIIYDERLHEKYLDYINVNR